MAKKKSGYGKRPAWQLVLMYLVIGGLLYWAIYALYMKKDTKTNGGLYGANTENSVLPGDESDTY